MVTSIVLARPQRSPRTPKNSPPVAHPVRKKKVAYAVLVDDVLRRTRREQVPHCLRAGEDEKLLVEAVE